MKLVKSNRHYFIMLLIILIHGSIDAQVKYKSVKDNTYVFDESNCVVYNNNLKETDAAHKIVSEGFQVQKNTIVNDIFKETLSTQRLQDLKGEKMAVTFECDTKGKVENVKFVFTKTPFLTPAEIHTLETKLLSKTFTIKTELNSVRIRFSIPCFFSKLIE
ncbi:MAG: hypothetical protein K2K25_04630 [Muribaculaceae bacterium]|nr:hypothetical protein [Muribaculaceae bacterium]